MCRNQTSNNCQNRPFHHKYKFYHPPFSLLFPSPPNVPNLIIIDCKTPPNSENPMEKIQETTHDHDSTNSTPTRSFPPSPDPSSPAPHSPAAESSLSSDLSHHSSLSHGSSPEQEKSRKQVSPPGKLPARSSPEQEKTRRPDSPPGDSPAYSPARSPSPEPMVFRFARGETEAVRKVDPGSADGGGRRVYRGAAVEGGGGGGRRPRAGTSSLRRGMREETVRKVGLGLRVCGLFFCLVSLAVMASDKNKGWAVDSFFRYKEFRYFLNQFLSYLGGEPISNEL